MKDQERVRWKQLPTETIYKPIHNIVKDIYYVVQERKLSENFYENLGNEVGKRLIHWNKPSTYKAGLRLSKMGPSCPKAFWHSIHTPELAEPLPAPALIKFTYGHTIEALVLALAKEAGYAVEGEQDELTLLGVKGHRDCVIRGCTVDVKSCSGRVFDKIKAGHLSHSDDFGYLAQLDAYVTASRMGNDQLVTDREHGYILAVHKELGHLYLYEHKIRSEEIQQIVRERIQIAGQSEPPACRCNTVPEGSSGNIRLDVQASYSPYKYCCFPTLRTFLYARGPVFLTTVKRLPDVPEVNKHQLLVQSGHRL